MNIFQRIILVLGAATLVAAILTTPMIVNVQGMYAKPSAADLIQIELEPMITPSTAIVRSVGVIGVTVLLFFALSGIELKKRAKKAKPKM
ncbi:MAG: hypothetical protein JXA50_07400 [Deltaproteobacteria bacterium]|nr:hypothetical protein [Deltaproteobacteria bacterium]